MVLGVLVVGNGCSGWERLWSGGNEPARVTLVQVDSLIQMAVSHLRDSLREAGECKSVDSPVEKYLRELGMVNIAEEDSSIAVQLVYATSFNFVGKILYKDLRKAFMLPETAKRLLAAQAHLKRVRPDLNLIVYDAARPLSVQAEMWEAVKGTDEMIFVSNPVKGGGLHNFGAAVDVSLIDCTGVALSMGCPYDFFGAEAKITQEEELFRSGLITQRELENRRLLRKVMTDAGFRSLASEWWHFNLMSSKEAQETLVLIE